MPNMRARKAPVLDAAVATGILAVYERHWGLLTKIATMRFNVPEDDAESLVQDVMLTYVRSHAEVQRAEKWLLGAISNASRSYWRERRKNSDLGLAMVEVERVDPDPTNRVVGELLIKQLMSRLQGKCRRTLNLRYREGYSIEELAGALETTPRYAEKMIHKCLKRARRFLLQIEGR